MNDENKENQLRLKVHDFLSLTVVEMLIEKGIISADDLIGRLDSRAGAIDYEGAFSPREILVIQAEFAMIRERIIAAG